MSGPLIVNFDYATRDGVVEGSLAVSDLDDVEVRVGDTIGVMDSGAGPYEAEVIAVDADRIRVRAPALSVPRSRPGLADAEDIERWAGTHKARSELPRLVRRLLADTPGVTDLSIRAGRGVDFSGWDGRVDGGSGAAYVPAGQSCWEMSTSRDPERRTQENYRNRTKDPKGVDPAETAFVFVTPCRWGGRDAWENSRRGERKWRDVRVLDADDLEGWLESRYGVHVWFSEQLGLRPGDVETLARWWSRWLAATGPPMPKDLLLARRNDEAEELRAKLDGNPSATGIKAGSRDEAIAFAAAVLHATEDPDPLSRSFVVARAASWNTSVSTHGRSILIPTFEGADAAAAVNAGHHVLIPMEAGDTGHAMELPRIGRSETRTAFEHLGIESDKADRYAVRARRSLASLRRALSLDPRAARPGWAQGQDADVLAALVLVGAWSENSEADQETVASVVNRDYESVERLLRRWESTGDPPFRRSGTSWRLSNPEDAWLLLNNQIIPGDLERWSEAVRQVLGSRDPFLDLDPRDRFIAPLRGLGQRWSFDLRRGLAQGLALLAALELPRSVADQTGSGHAKSVLRDLLDRAGNDETGKLWQQLADVLPLLAEAAPGVFLDAIRRDSQGEAPLLRKVFTDSEEFMSSAHTGLLRGLERLCWMPEHLSAAMDALLRLDKVDPGGRLADRPMESARMVLWPLLPQTGASPERRMATLDGLVERYPNASRLLLELVPRPGSYWTDNDKPRFRDWSPEEKLTKDKNCQAIEAIRSRVSAMETDADRGLDPTSSRLEELVTFHADLFGWQPYPDADRQTVLEQRCSAIQEVFDFGGVSALRSFAGRVHRPELVGSVNAIRHGDQFSAVLPQFLTNGGTDRDLALGWVNKMAEMHGTDWAGRVLQDSPGLTYEARADILLTLPPTEEAWKLVSKEDEDVREAYWRLIRRRRVAPEHFATYLDKLLEYDRVRLAVEVTWVGTRRDATELVENGTVARVLTSASEIEVSPFRETDVYHIGQLMDLLGPDSDTVVSLEGRLFLPLQMLGRSPTALHQRLQRDPSRFVDLVCQADRRADESQQKDENGMTVPQGSAWSILQGWRIPPGYDTDAGEWSIDILKNWLGETQRLLKERDRSDIGDMFIGEMLSGSPTGNDGAWPAEPVRDLLEALESEHLEDGLVSGAVTSRGRTAHRMLEGGEQERGLGGLYREMASKIETRWLRSAEVLRRLADHYEEEARQRDEQAERLADFD